MNLFNIAIVGFGGMGSEHGRKLKTMKTINLAGIFDIDPKRMEYAKEHDFPTYASFEQVLKDEKVDLILIATPNNSHKEIAIQAMKAGKNVICEKPVAMDSTELEEILKVEKETGKTFVVHQNRRWDEDFLVIKKLYDEKTLGDVFHLESRVHGSRGIPGDWRRVKAFGGGMMLDWGVHLIDRILYMINEKITKVYCRLTHINDSEVDDGVMLFLTFESGKTALIEVGTVNFISYPLWYLAGNKGTAVIKNWDMEGEVVTLEVFEENNAAPVVAGVGLTKTMAKRGENTVVTSDIPRIDTDVRDFYTNVVNHIRNGEELAIKNCEVMRVMKLMETSFKSAEQNLALDFE